MNLLVVIHTRYLQMLAGKESVFSDGGKSNKVIFIAPGLILIGQRNAGRIAYTSRLDT